MSILFLRNIITFLRCFLNFRFIHNKTTIILIISFLTIILQPPNPLTDLWNLLCFLFFFLHYSFLFFLWLWIILFFHNIVLSLRSQTLTL